MAHKCPECDKKLPNLMQLCKHFACEHLSGLYRFDGDEEEHLLKFRCLCGEARQWHLEGPVPPRITASVRTSHVFSHVSKGGFFQWWLAHKLGLEVS